MCDAFVNKTELFTNSKLFDGMHLLIYANMIYNVDPTHMCKHII